MAKQRIRPVERMLTLGLCWNFSTQPQEHAMATKKQLSRERQEFWRLVLKEYAESRLSIRAFCKREGIHDAMFYRWRKKLAKLETPILIPVKVVDPPQEPRPTQRSKETHGESTLEIKTPFGFTLRLVGRPNRTYLQDVLSVIQPDLSKRDADSC